MATAGTDKLTPISTRFNEKATRGVPANPAVDGGNPTSAELLTKYGFFNGVTGGSGIVTITFPAAFPTGIVYAQATTTAGASVNPVINGGAISKTSMTFIYPGVAAGTSVKFMWVAVGW